MVVLHFAAVSESQLTGVNVVVPQHIRYQSAYAQVGLVNIKNIMIADIPVQFPYQKPFHISQLPEPFCRPDIVVFHECYRADYLLIGRELEKHGIPYVVLPHGELGREAQQKKRIKKIAANLLLFNRFTSHAAAIQCLSEREREETFFGKKKIIGTNGVSIPAEKKTSFSDHGIRLLYIGRLDAFHKGLDLMIEAVSMVRDRMTAENATLDIYGPDYQGRYAHVEELIKNADVGDLVRLHHEVTGEEKKRLLLESDVFVQTSRFEGMPLGILEAMSYGIPCLVTEGTNLGKEIAAHSAGWAGETSARGVADALLRAMDDKALYRSIGENGRAFVEETFSWPIIAEQTVRLYEELIH